MPRPALVYCLAQQLVQRSVSVFSPLTAGRAGPCVPTAQKVVVPGWEGSKLVTHPLAEEAGGDPHHGGGQQFTSQNDPDWQTLKAFVLGAKLK